MSVQAIIYTAHQDHWRPLAKALGMVALGEASDMWEEHAGHGILAIHGAAAGSEKAGTTEIHLLVRDLDVLIETLTARGIAHSVEDADTVGRIVVAHDAQGVTISASEDNRSRTDGPLTVMPLQFTPDVVSATELYKAFGLAPRIASDAGGWIDFTADGGGLAALHHDDAVSLGLTFEYSGNIDDLAQRLRESGYEPVIVDEAYNRTLQVETPDRGMLWISEESQDLYGYSRISSAR